MGTIKGEGKVYLGVQVGGGGGGGFTAPLLFPPLQVISDQPQVSRRAAPEVWDDSR